VWVGICMMGDVIRESAPSKSAALRTSVVPGHTQTWATSQQFGEVICKQCIYRDARTVFPTSWTPLTTSTTLPRLLLTAPFAYVIRLVIVERAANRDTIRLKSTLVKIQKCRFCGQAAAFVHSIAALYTPLKDLSKPKGEKNHPNNLNRSVSSYNIPHTRQVLFPTWSK
jgi:hypothetical protein